MEVRGDQRKYREKIERKPYKKKEIVQARITATGKLNRIGGKKTASTLTLLTIRELFHPPNKLDYTLSIDIHKFSLDQARGDSGPRAIPARGIQFAQEEGNTRIRSIGNIVRRKIIVVISTKWCLLGLNCVGGVWLCEGVAGLWRGKGITAST